MRTTTRVASMPPIGSDYLTIPEAAAYCRVSIRTIQRWLQLGLLPYHRPAYGRRVLIRRVVASTSSLVFPRGAIALTPGGEGDSPSPSCPTVIIGAWPLSTPTDPTCLCSRARTWLTALASRSAPSTGSWRLEKYRTTASATS